MRNLRKALREGGRHLGSGSVMCREWQKIKLIQACPVVKDSRLVHHSIELDILAEVERLLGCRK